MRVSTRAVSSAFQAVVSRVRLPLSAPNRLNKTMEILGKVLKIIAKQTDNKYEPDINSTLQDMGMDSLDVVELVMAIEDEFNIDIRDEVLDSIVTIGNLVEVVEKEL